MQIPKTAIERAIEGGWQANKGPRSKLNEFNRYYEQAVALDPTFWQALGKALRWDEQRPLANGVDTYNISWHSTALQFYDLILTEQPTDAFWKEILQAN